MSVRLGWRIEGNGRVRPRAVLGDAIEHAEFKARPPVLINVVGINPAPDKWETHRLHLARHVEVLGGCGVCIERGRL